VHKGLPLIQILAGIILMWAVSCQVKGPSIYIKLAGPTQGTAYHISYESFDSIHYQNEIDSLLRQFDLSLSTYDTASIISKINRDEQDVDLDHFFISCFNAAKEIYGISGGSFDITIAPVVNAWGFGFTDRMEVDSNLIDSLLQFVGMDKIHISDNRIVKEMPGIMMDVNAIAQGYAADVVAEFLENKGIENYLVEIGGEVTAKGFNDRNQYWRVGIDKPIDGLQIPGVQMEAIISLKNRSLATSGNYRRFYVKDGIKYSHTIDPCTGYPVDHNLLSATVLADDCMSADAYATAFMVMGLEKSIELLKGRDDLEVYFIYSDGTDGYKTYCSPGLKKHLQSRGSV